MAKPGKQLPKQDNTPIQKTAPLATEQSTRHTGGPVADLFDKFGTKTWLAALGLIFVIAFIVFKDYLLFDKVYLFKDIGSDTLNGLYPYIYHTASELGAHHGFPVWSYSWGMGQNIFPQLFRDPFDIFLFLAGKDHIAYGIVYKELSKVLLGGLLFFFYLRTLKLSNFTAITGSLLFAFCAFMIVGGGWSFFSFEAFSMALLLLAFELMFSRNQWFQFPIAIFLIAISTPVNLYIYGLFLACYALLRCYQAGAGDLKGIGTTFLKMAGFGMIGVLASAPFVIPNILMILESPRGSGGSSYADILSSMPMFGVSDKLNFGTCMMRFFASDLLGSGNEFRGWQNILEAPMFYCGIPCLLLMPQVFQFLSKRVKIVFGIFLGVWLLPIIFPYFRYAFWLFSGDYYRAYSFFVSLVFLYYALQALEFIVQQKKINLVILIATVVLLFIVLNYPFFDKEFINQPVFAFVSLLILIYGGLLYFMAKQGTPVYLKYIFLGVVAFELMYFSGVSVNQRDAITSAELTEKIGYNDYSVEAVSFIKKSDKSFYRIDKNYASSPAMHGSLNDAMVHEYYGTSSYNSFNQGNYITYLQLMGLVDKKDELQTRWATGLISRPILESVNGVKYILAKKNINPLWQIVCDSMATFGDVRVYKNKYALPMGFTYNQYIRKSVFSNLNPVQKDFVSLAACVVEDADVSKVQGLKEYQLSDTISQSGFTFDLYRARVNELSKDTLSNPVLGTKVISGKINVNEDKVVYLSIPFDAGWILNDNGQVAEKLKLSDGMTGIALKKGQHSIELTYKQRYASAGWGMVVAALLLYAGLLFVVRKKPSSSNDQ